MSGALQGNLENARQQEAFSAEMGAGVAQIDLDEGPKRQEDDGITGYSWEHDGDDIVVEVVIPKGLSLARSLAPSLLSAAPPPHP